MDRIVQQVEFKNHKQKMLKRVAAYARVSCDKDAMLHSLSAQVSCYSTLIQSNPEWIYCGVFVDEGLTGTKSDRDNFQRLLDECRSGHIDLILTKSISRFARNTVTLLETVRELKLLGVDVFFEQQGIHTLSAEGELLLTILASYAQEESFSASENQKWKIRKDFEQGKIGSITMLGYKRTSDGHLEIIPEQAAIVRRIFSEYLSGNGLYTIAKILNEEGIPPLMGGQWCFTDIARVLKNEKYAGDMLLQKYYRENHITKKEKVNKGQLPQYYVEESHPAIINKEDFDLVQKLLHTRHEKFSSEKSSEERYPFSGIIKCGCCGKHYRRRTLVSGVKWCCATYNNKGKRFCPESKMIPESELVSLCCKVLELPEFDEEVFYRQIKQLFVPKPNHITFIFNDGHEIDAKWKDRSRSESWTPEMKEKARIDGCRRK